MATTSFNATQITPPRVPIIDDRTGLVSREWYRYFYSLYAFTGNGTGILPIPSGGTGIGTIPTDGQLLIGDTASSGYKLHVIDTGSGIGITNGAGTILITNTGVLSNIAGSGIGVSSATGNVTVSNTGVLSFSGGGTGLLPSSATTGAVSLSGTLGVANGGTNASTASITSFNNITGYSASGATGTTSTNLVFSTSPSITTPTLVGDANLNTGNLIQGTAAKGINFTANSPASGMTSQLLNWYEEGTWTPSDQSGAGLTLTVLANSAKYVRTGRMVTATFALSYPVTAAAGQATIGGLPFTAGSGAGQGGYLVYTSLASIPGLNVSPSTTKFYLYGGGGTGLSNVNMSAQDIRGVVTYFV
jgi:hypothetical protein